MEKNIALSKGSILTNNSILTQTLWIVGFAAATAIGARVEIPHVPVPFTLQTLFVLLAGAFLGARNGAISQVVYLAVGVLGAPVFAGGGFGLVKLFGPTGGYLLAFPLTAALVGLLTGNFRSYVGVVLSMFAGLILLFLCGTLHLNAFYMHDLSVSFKSGFLIFSLWDIVKLFAAATIYYEMAKRWRRLG
jgi:biotin transport system substrate-specific component